MLNRVSRNKDDSHTLVSKTHSIFAASTARKALPHHNEICAAYNWCMLSSPVAVSKASPPSCSSVISRPQPRSDASQQQYKGVLQVQWHASLMMIQCMCMYLEAQVPGPTWMQALSGDPRWETKRGAVNRGPSEKLRTNEVNLWKESEWKIL